MVCGDPPACRLALTGATHARRRERLKRTRREMKENENGLAAVQKRTGTVSQAAVHRSDDVETRVCNC